MEILKSKIILCKGIHLDKDYINVLNYSESEMVSLCETKAIASANDYDFIRNTGRISTAFSYDVALKSDYIAFQNKDYSNKWFFAFIDDVIYKGENVTEIAYTVDVWSTWYSYWTAKPCFVVREHVNDDTIGLHTLPENLACNDFVCEDSYSNQDLVEIGTLYHVAVLSAWQPKDGSTGTEIGDSNRGTQFSGISLYNKNVFGNKLFIFKISQASDYADLSKFIYRTNVDGHIEDVKNIFIVPKALIPDSDLTAHTASVGGVSFTFYTVAYSTTPKEFSISITKPSAFTGLSVKNNKVFTYPYCYLYVTNNSGNANVFKFENFYNSTSATFEIDLSVSIGVSGKVVATNYKKIDDALIDNRYDEEAIPLAKFPTCEWSSDAYTNWLTQNAVNEPMKFALGLFGMGSSYQSGMTNASLASTEAKSASIAGATSVNLGFNIASSIANIIGNFYAGALMPNIQGGANTGDVNFGENRNTFMFRTMRLKDEEIKVIDDYFTKYGYKVNRLKTPNITGRTYWNYVEIAPTEEVGTGEMPSKYMDTINQIFRRGVTIWHSHSNIGNFNLNNTIVSSH